MIKLILDEIADKVEYVNHISKDGEYHAGYLDALNWVLRQLPEEG